MDNDNLVKVAQDIIKSNVYLTLATVGETPWTAPVFYTADDRYNFYFASKKDTLHGQHISQGSKVAFAIFDSHAKVGEGNGIQGVGTAKIIEEQELPEAFKWYQTTFLEMKPENFSGDAPYRIFKITPEKMYIQDPVHKGAGRVEVTLI